MQDEVDPSIVCMLFRFIIVELQSGASHQVVAGVKVIQLCVPHIAGGVDEAVRWVCGDGHSTPKVADKKAKGVPLAGIASSLKSITHCLKVNLYVLDEV